MENEFLIFNCSISDNRSVDLTDLPKIMSTLNLNVQNAVHFNFMEAEASPSNVSGCDSPTTDYESSDCCTPTSPDSSPRPSSRTRRTSYQNALHRVKRRVIAKPKKVINYSNENEVRNYYLNNNKFSKYKQSSLETIFEETAIDSDKDALVNLTKISQLIGKRKIKRSIAFTDCLNVPRSIIANRRKRIKRLLGRNMKLQKLSMDAFLKHIKSLGYGCDTITPGDLGEEHASNEIESDIEFVTANERSSLENEPSFSKSNEI